MGIFNETPAVLPRIVCGVCAGWILPIIEGCGAVAASSGESAIQIMQAILSQSTFDASCLDTGGYLFALTVVAIGESFLMGRFGETWSTVGYCFGALIGAVIWAHFLYTIFPGAITATLGTVLIIFLGVTVKIGMSQMRSRSNRSGYS